MRVTRPARVILAEAMVFAATTLAAASVALPVTNTGAAMCGATGAPTMDPWFRRFELEGADLLPGGPPGPNPARDTAAFSRSSIGRKAPKSLKPLSGNLGISGPERGPNLDAGRCLSADAAASLKISISDLVE
jgi:hypothetical protein